jgi:hypothetical protein
MLTARAPLGPYTSFSDVVSVLTKSIQEAHQKVKSFAGDAIHVRVGLTSYFTFPALELDLQEAPFTVVFLQRDAQVCIAIDERPAPVASTNCNLFIVLLGTWDSHTD